MAVRKLKNGLKIDNSISTPDDGTITIEEWRRRRDSLAEVHFVRRTGGDAA